MMLRFSQPLLPFGAKYQSSNPKGTLEGKVGIVAGGVGKNRLSRNTEDIMGS